MKGQEVILTRGLPRSGKSTWVKKLVEENPNVYKRINRDSLRLMLAEEQTEKTEKYLLSIRDMLIKRFLDDGYSVICDDLNLSKKHEARIRQLVGKQAEVKIVDHFLQVPLDQLIYRNNNSPESEKVPEKVIRDLYAQFCGNLSKEQKADLYQEKRVERNYIPYDPTLPDCFIFDIDGTLAMMQGRRAYDWSRVGEDLPDPVVTTLIRKLYALLNATAEESPYIFVVSGRDSVCMQETQNWLDAYEIFYDDIYMRPEGNNEKDAIIKERIYREYFEGKYNILAVFDDRNQTVEKWRELGLLCCQVAPGNF